MHTSLESFCQSTAFDLLSCIEQLYALVHRTLLRPYPSLSQLGSKENVISLTENELALT